MLLPIVMGLRSCLSPLGWFSLDWESAWKGEKGRRHSPEKGSNRTLHLGCETWNAPLRSLPRNFCPFFRCINCRNETRQWGKVGVYPNSIPCPVSWNHCTLSYMSRPNTWVCSLYLDFPHLVSVYYHRSTSCGIPALRRLWAGSGGRGS